VFAALPRPWRHSPPSLALELFGALELLGAALKVRNPVTATPAVVVPLGIRELLSFLTFLPVKLVLLARLVQIPDGPEAGDFGASAGYFEEGIAAFLEERSPSYPDE
jgi:hypothetical protein